MAQKVDSFEKNLTASHPGRVRTGAGKGADWRARSSRCEEQAQQETLRANLLRAISHDLRTPLTSISGQRRHPDGERGRAGRGEAAATCTASIYDDSMWLINLVENLLSLTRMEQRLCFV